MDIVSANEQHWTTNEHLPQNNTDLCSNESYSTTTESQEATDQLDVEVDNDFDTVSDEDDLKIDLQKSFPGCYKSEHSYSSSSYSEITNEELQASALCQFMDILNDLDEVLDKSLLACLDDGTKTLDSDEDDVICKNNVNTDDNIYLNNNGHSSSLINNNRQMISNDDSPQPTSPSEEQIVSHYERPRPLNLGRSKSFTSVTTDCREPITFSVQQTSTHNDELRSSMRRLDPILLPAITTQEQLTLPVILFLEHHVNMRPTSAPIQLQVTAANLSGDVASGPLIVGRRTLLMNHALSSPSPGSAVLNRDWRNTTNSVARSMSASSSSSESLNGLPPSQPTVIPEERTEETGEPSFDVWPHQLSSMLACFSCTVGIFNVSRFAMFSVHFGANFIIQFIILSLLIGIPLFTLHLCLGQVLEAGPIDMWRISPIFQGVGITLLLVQAVIGIYSIISLSWLFVYFRDSFISSTDKYKWSLPLDLNNEDMSLKVNGSFKIQETLPQYFHGEVLQRNLAYSSSYFGTIKFQVAFNVAVLWMIVFISLSKGLRSYGKTVYILTFVPVCGIITLCIKILSLIPYDSLANVLADTVWNEFFINSNSWAAAAQETFLTWGLLGVCVMQLTSYKNIKSKSRTALQRESTCIVLLTFTILILAAFLANACIVVLKKHGYVYLPGSFENVKSSQFLWPINEPLPGSSGSIPVRYMGHYGSLVGVTVWRGGGVVNQLSGWQPLQLLTQLVPATLAVVTTEVISPAWAGIFYFTVIVLGIAQQLVIWHCVVAGVVSINKRLQPWDTVITFLSCVLGLLVGLIFTTDGGIRVVQFVDYVWVGAWWQGAAQVALACGVFAVRGRPYTGDVVVAALFGARGVCAALSALLSFTWNVVLPVTLCAICVIDFRTGDQRQLYTWRKPTGYYPIWARQIAVLLQQGALLTMPAAAFVQTWRYMSKGPPDILDRIQNLYRPRLDTANESVIRDANGGVPGAPGVEVAAATLPAMPDPPPKYTPPPSYSTATGARLLNSLRRSFRTLRRMTTSRAESGQAPDAQVAVTLSESVDQLPLTQPQPPDYSGLCSAAALTLTDETRRTEPRRSLSFTRDILRRSFVRNGTNKSTFIRSSLRRSFRYGSALTTSHEQLVRSAEPMSSTAAVSDLDWSTGHSCASVI